LISVSLLVVVSLLTKPSSPEKWAPFFMTSEEGRAAATPSPGASGPAADSP
jgi:hypothetical protein